MELGFRAFLFRTWGKHSIIAGSLPNFVAVILIALASKVIKGDKPGNSPLKMSLMAVLAMVFYEGAQLFIQGRTFDWFDVLASVLGGVFVYLLLSLIESYAKPDRGSPSQE